MGYISDKSLIVVPEELWSHAPQGKGFYAVRLRDGSIYRNLFIDKDGRIRGELVNTPAVFDPKNLHFTGDDIVAIREDKSILSLLKPWVTRE